MKLASRPGTASPASVPVPTMTLRDRFDIGSPSLLGLPAERRNTIYESLLIHDETIQLLTNNRGVLRCPIEAICQLSACGQIRQEVYSRNVFRILSYPARSAGQDSIGMFAAWLNGVGPCSRVVRKSSSLWRRCNGCPGVPSLCFQYYHAGGQAIVRSLRSISLQNTGAHELSP
jgi:hypothetical protein